MITRRNFLFRTASVGAIAALGISVSTSPALAAPQNPQRIATGFPFPVYINSTGTNQSVTPGNYVNQTQYNPATPSIGGALLTLGVGN